MLNLSPDRNQQTDPDPSFSLPFAMVYAGLAFGLVSVAAYSIWAYRLIPGPGPMYASIAVVYLGLSGLALSRLVLTQKSAGKFCLFFALTFLIYATFWCLFWFGLKGRYHADLYGSALGLAAMVWFFQKAFRKNADFLPCFAVLFTCHTLGYYLGGEGYALVSGSSGRLLWGAGHGLGFGAGLGYILYQFQQPEKSI